jgi:hypothetical protein
MTLDPILTARYTTTLRPSFLTTTEAEALLLEFQRELWGALGPSHVAAIARSVIEASAVVLGSERDEAFDWLVAYRREASPRVGQRVELHPATDHWMRGDRYGVVTGVREDATVDVALDKSRRIIRFRPEDILRVVEVWDGVARNVATARVLRGEDD